MTVHVFVFAGPTLDRAEGRRELDAVWLPPVSQGDVYRAALKRPAAIGIVDGRYQDVPAVWHKEILWALKQGVAVYGSASMGALRAAELAVFGMRGVGRIFGAFRDGVLEDDDEVAVAHAGEEDGFAATSESMVNIRWTLEAAERDGRITPATAATLIGLAKGTFFPLRSWRRLLLLGRQAALPTGELDALRAWLPNHRVDQKKADALQMLRVIRGDLDAGIRPEVTFSFQHTQHFERARRSAGELILDVSDSGGVTADSVTLEELLDELRLDPDAYADVRQRALTRCLAVRAGRRGAAGSADDAALQAAADRFRRARHLHEPQDAQRWLDANHLTHESFAALIREEQALRDIETAMATELDVYLRSQLRADGSYERLAARVRGKRRLLSRLGLDDPATSHDLDDHDVVAWYFGRRGARVPADLRGHWRAVGFSDEAAFLRAVRREYWFSTRDEGADDRTDRPARARAAPD